MSKSLGNYIGIDESPEIMFEKSMRIPDDVLFDYFRLTTDMDLDKVKVEMEKDIVEAHKIYAREIIKMYHGEEFIEYAEERYATVAKGGVPENIDVYELDKTSIDNGILITDLLVKSGIVPSKSEGKRMIEQNGITRDLVSNSSKMITINDFVDNEIIIQKGKKSFKKVVLV